VEFRILGSMEILDGGQRVELPSGRGRSLLALLTLHAGEPVAAERLIDELWGGDPPASAATVVQGLVSRLRRALEPDRTTGEPPHVLQTAGNAYCLAIDPDSVDANRFKRLFDEARGGSPEVRAAKLSAALALWRGPALADFIYEPFAQRAIVVLEEFRVEAVEDMFEAELALGRDAHLVSGLREAIASYPFRERLRGFLMVALYRAGRQTEALDVFRDTRALLSEELGLEPGPALRELEVAILRQDPTLELRRAPEPQMPSRGEAPSWLPRERRTVTVAAVDVAPTADLSCDTEAVARMGSRAARVATEILQRHGARVERSLGDELIGFFGFPAAHEDDPLRAVRAVLDVRTAVHSPAVDPAAIEGMRQGARAGVETGDIVVAGPGAALRDVVMGPVVSAARRLEHAAANDEILIGTSTQRLVRGAVIVKPVEGGGGAPAMAWRVLESVARASAISRAMDAPMIGRQSELTQLRSTFRRAIRTGAVRITIIGEAGSGKSRLAQEVVVSLGDDAHAIRLRCTPPGEGMGFFPVRQAVLEAAGLRGWRGLYELLQAAAKGNSAVPQIGAAVGLCVPPATVNELLEVLARDHPLIVVLDNLHWADAAFLEMIDRLEREANGRIMLLCLARPDFVEDRAASSIGDVITLEPLQPSQVASLVIDRGGPVAQAPLQRIVTLSQGNPLYAEQLIAAIADGDVDAIPASLVGLLSMRLDRLGPGERDLLRGVRSLALISSSTP
jgi:DNA-binding SARP family transcriptional activator